MGKRLLELDFMGLVSGFGTVSFVCCWEVEVLLVVCRSSVVCADVAAEILVVCRLQRCCPVDMVVLVPF